MKSHILNQIGAWSAHTILAFSLLACSAAQNGAPSDRTPLNLQSGTGGPTYQGDGGNVNKTDNGNGYDGGYVDLRLPANLVIQPPGYDFGTVGISSVNYLTFQVENTGDLTATNMAGAGLSGPFTYRAGNYPGFRGTCGTTLEPHSTCVFTVSFIPNTVNTFRSAFSFSYNNGTIALPLAGNSINVATLRFNNLVDDNKSWDFGTIASPNTITKQIHVNHFGSKTATGVSFSGVSAPFSIVSNTCGLNVATDCDLTIQYSSSVIGVTSQILKVSYNNSSFAAEDNFTLTGNTAAQQTPATLLISDGGSNTFGRVLNGTTSDHTFYVTKGGSLAAQNVSAGALTAPFSYKGGIYPGTGGTCGTLITADCTLVLSFAPASSGNYSQNISLTFDNGAGSTPTATRSVSGSGGEQSALTLTPATNPVDFGAVPVGAYSDLFFVLSNPSTAMPATAISFPGFSAPFSYQGGCGNTLNPGSSCTFGVRFRPQSVSNFTGQFNVSYFDGVGVNSSSLQRNLSGSGSSGAVLSVSASTYNFGTVMIGTTVTASITLSYYGALPATIQSASLSGPFTFPGGSFSGGGTCGSQITGSCTMVVAFSPTEVTNYSNVLTVTYDNGNGQTANFTITLLGAGGPNNPAVLTFSGANPLDFGSVAVGSKRSVTVTLNRSGNKTASAITASGLNAIFAFEGGVYPGSGGTCQASMSASSCTLVLSFSPTSTGAQGPTTLTLSYFDGNAPQSLSLTLTGTGVSLAALSYSGGNFPATAVGGSNDVTITIVNNGSRSADSVGLAAPFAAAPFSIAANNCPTTIASQASCGIVVRYSPTAPGNQNGSFTVAYSNGANAVSLSVFLTGSATVPLLVEANGNHTCARLMNGSLKCWGQNNYGQLGIGDLRDRGDTSGTMGSNLPAVNLGSGHYATALALGYSHTCALLEDDSVRCWGLNSYGQLGIGSSVAYLGGNASDMGAALPAVNLGTGAKAIALTAGYADTCALLSDGSVKCWGQNNEGQLGQGDTFNRGLSTSDMGDNLPPIDLGGKSATQISANTGHTCALLSDGSVKCWGDNFYGQLGLGDSANRGDTSHEMGAYLPPVNLGSGVTAKAITTGGAFTCALLSSGVLKCWGRNEDGILGRTYCQDANGNVGDCTDSNYPLSLLGYGTGPNQMGDALPTISLGTGRLVKQVRAANSSTCVQLDNNALKCWGENQYGQLGLEDTNTRGASASDMGDNLPTVNLGSGLSVVALSAADYHACAILNNQSLKCWGYNRYGNLGLESTQNRGDAFGTMGDRLPAVSY